MHDGPAAYSNLVRLPDGRVGLLIETGEERIQKGKLPEGRIDINLSQNENMLNINYKDDGSGLNLKKLKELGFERSIFMEGEEISTYQIAELIFHDGLSTAPSVTEISGRGVGMGAIKRYIEQAGGAFELKLDDEHTMESVGVPFSIVISLPENLFTFVSNEQQKAS